MADIFDQVAPDTATGGDIFDQIAPELTPSLQLRPLGGDTLPIPQSAPSPEQTVANHFAQFDPEEQHARELTNPLNRVASLVGPPLHGGIEVTKRLAEDISDDAAALFLGQKMPQQNTGAINVPGLRNVSAFANNPTAPSPSDVESKELLGPKMRAVEQFGKAGVTMPAFMGEVALTGGAGLPAILGTTPEGEVDPVGLVLGLTVGKVHQGTADWIKSKFFADTVKNLAPSQMRAMYQRFAAGQATAEDAALMTKINELKTKGQSLRDLQREGGTMTVPWAATPKQAAVAKIAAEAGGMAAANGYFLAVQMPSILSSENPKEALLEAVAQLAGASVPGLFGLAKGPGMSGRGRLDINGAKPPPPSAVQPPPPSSSGFKSGEAFAPRALPDIRQPESVTLPPGGSAGDIFDQVAANPPANRPSLVEQARQSAQQATAAAKPGEAPYTAEQALQDLPKVVQDLKDTLLARQISQQPKETGTPAGDNKPSMVEQTPPAPSPKTIFPADTSTQAKRQPTPPDIFDEVAPEPKPNDLEYPGGESSELEGYIPKSAPTDPESKIVNPIDPKLSQPEKAAELLRLSKETEPLVKDITAEITRTLGIGAKYSFKEQPKIIGKANRPEIKAEKPWHDVEHIRDSLRFKAQLASFDQVPDILDIIQRRGFSVVKLDTKKMFAPKEWGWRFVAFDLRAPNGQLVEFYAPFKELDQKSVKGPNHELFEKWRNRTKQEMADNWSEYRADVQASMDRYQNAWNAGLSRLHLTDAAARASWSSIVARLESMTREKRSFNSSAEGAAVAPNTQDPSDLRRAGTSKSQAITSPLSDSETIGKESLIAPKDTPPAEKPQSNSAEKPNEIKAESIPLTPQDETKNVDKTPIIPEDKSNDANPTTGASDSASVGGSRPGPPGAPGREPGVGEVSERPGSSVSPSVRADDGQPTPASGVDGNRSLDADVSGVSDGQAAANADAGAVESGRGSTGSVRGSESSIQLPGGSQRRNLRLTSSLAPTGGVARIKANIAAIKVLKSLDGKQPTDDQVAILAQWSGWGSFKNLFAEGKAERREFDTGWQKRYGRFYDQLRSLLTESEFNGAAESSVNAHYTGPDVVVPLHDIARRLGFSGGKVLEAGAGAGAFIGHQPADLADASRWTAIEMDTITGQLLALLYPEADTRIQPFEESKLPNAYFDLNIGNYPFHEVGPGKEYPDLNLHNYFFARALDKIKPGGLIIAITSKGTMDANPRQRELLASKGQLVGAIRLPNNAFKESADTEVVTDIVILRRPDGKPFNAQPWKNVVNVAAEGEPPMFVNEYFAAHPEMVLGKHALTGSMYGKNEYTVEGTGPLGPKLAAAIERLPKDIMTQSAGEEEIVATKRDDYAIYINGDGHVVESRNYKEGLPDWNTTSKTLVETAKHYIGTRDTLKDQYRMERTEGVSEEEIEANRKKLARRYKALVRHLDKPLANSEAKLRHLESDPDFYTVLGLEYEKTEIDPEDPTKTKVTVLPSDVLSKRVGHPDTPPDKAANASDALGISQAYKGGMDLDYVRQLTGLSDEAITAELVNADLAYLDVDTGKLVTRGDYLSGDIRDKYAKAIFAAKEDPHYLRNVEALKKVIPKDDPFGKIKFGIEGRWIPEAVHNAFARDVIGLDGDPVKFQVTTEDYAVTNSKPTKKQRANSGLSGRARVDYSTGRKTALELLESALNMQEVRIVDTDRDGKRVVDQSGTDQANKIVTKIKGEFVKWTQTTDVRVPYRLFDSEKGEYRVESLPVWDVLEREWNRKKNSFVSPEYDGTRLKLPGVSDWFWRKQHILDGVQRGIQTGSGVFAFGVGSGKTSLMTILGHERKRIGLAKKHVFVVKKPTVGQFRTTIEALYPGSTVLIPSETDFKKKNRRKLISRIAAGKPDFIVLSHEQMKSIRPSEAGINAFFEEKIGELRSVLQEMGAAEAENAASTRGQTREVANLVRKIKTLKKTLDKQLTSLKKHHDIGLSWEDMGIDELHIDESHNFKNIPITTVLENVKGVPTSFSQRAVDLMIKARHVQGKQNGRGVFFYTGTPVSNTLAELWGQIHVTNPKLLEDMGVKTFDSFATAFAETVSKLEFGWDNRFKMVTRMSKFKNGAALTSLTRMGISVKIGNEELGLDVPKLKGGGPRVQIVPINPEFQRWLDLVEDASAAWDALEPRERRFNSWVPITVMRAGSAAALDPRCIFPDAQDHPDSKLNAAVKLIHENWQAGKDRRTTMMVFADLYRTLNTDKLRAFIGGDHSAPAPTAAPTVDLGPDDVKVEPTDEPEGEDADPAASDEDAMEANAVGTFNVYEDIRTKLVAMGIPEHEIAIITEHNSPTKRDALFDKVRAGAVRILMGSTEKIGEGVDVARLMSYQLHLDPPMSYTASKLEQRIGRLIRQGNLHSPKNWNTEVESVLLAQERSMDGPIYQMLLTKGKMTLQALKGQFLGDEFDDPASELTASMAALVAQATGDTRALEVAALTEKVRLLTQEENAYYRALSDAQRNRDQAESQVRAATKTATDMEELSAAAAKAIEDKDKMTLAGKKATFTGEKDIRAALDTLAKKFEGALEKDKDSINLVLKIGDNVYAGLSGSASSKWEFNGQKTVVVGLDRYYSVQFTASTFEPDMGSYGLKTTKVVASSELASVANLLSVLRSLPKRAADRAKENRTLAEEQTKEQATWQAKLESTKFPEEQELMEKRAELSRLEGDLRNASSRSPRALARIARKNGLLLEVNTGGDLPLEAEREKIRRQLDGIDAPIDEAAEKKIAGYQERIDKFREEERLPGEDRPYMNRWRNKEFYDKEVKQLEKYIEAAREERDSEKETARKTLWDRLKEIEAAMLEWLDKQIKATDYDPKKVLEGITGAPAWITRGVANAALRAVRAAIKAGRSMADAIKAGLDEMRGEPGFVEAEGKTYLERATRYPDGKASTELEALQAAQTTAEQALRYAVGVAADPKRIIPKKEADHAAAIATANLRDIQDRLAKHPDRFTAQSLEELNTAIAAAQGRIEDIAFTEREPGNGLTPEQRSERFKLLRDIKGLERERLRRHAYVADILRAAEQFTDELRQATASGDTTAARHAVEELVALQDTTLSRVPPEILDQVRADLEADGEIEPSSGENRGRTLGDLTAWLKSHKLDSPKLSLLDRVNLAKRLVDEFTAGKDLLTHALARTQAVWQAFATQWKAPVKDTEVRGIFKEWNYEKQFSGIETHQFAATIRAEVPQLVRRMAISVWMDADGDRNLLQFQRDSVPNRYLPIWEAALDLTSGEQSLAGRLKSDFAQKLSDGQLLGLINRGREDYGVPQIWKVPPEHGEDYDPADTQKRPRNQAAKLDPRDPFFSLKRTHASYFDGIMANGVPESLDIAYLVSRYNVDFHGSLADRAVIKALKDARMPDGAAAVKVSGSAKIQIMPDGARIQFVDSKWKPADAVTPEGEPYRDISHWALRDWKFAATDAAGNPILVQGDFLVHPDLHAALSTQLEGKSALRDPEGPLGAIAHITGGLLKSGAFLKASKFASATFHGATLAEHMMTHAFSGKPSRERMSLLNPIVRGIEVNPAKDAEVAGLIRNGMDMGFGGYRALFEEGLTSHGGIWARVPGLGDAMAWLSDGMFKEFLPRLKVKMGKVVLHANLERYSRELTQQQIYELTASQVNAAFGGQNWALLGRSKTFLDVNRLLFTAPDFLLSRAKVVGQAFKPYGREQQLFLLAQAALVYAGARVLNMILDDDPHWEPENALVVIHKGRAYSCRFIVNDIMHAFTDPAGFASGRLGPWPRTAFEMITGRDMRTGARKDVPIDTQNSAFRAAQIAVVDLAGWLVPVGMDGLLPGAKGREQTGPGQIALALVGVGSRRYTAETEMYELAAKFNRKSTNPKVLNQQKDRDDSPKKQTAYRKLDVLLEADDLEAARKEYRALIGDGHSKEAIAQRMKATTDGHIAHPFTGSQAQEAFFKASLTPDQLLEYNRAIEARKARAAKFGQMLHGQN